MAQRMSSSLGLGFFCRKRVAGHQHAGRAVTALQPVLGHEAGLQRVQRAVLLQALDRHELLAVGLHREHRARLHRAAVHEHGAGAAVRGVAADVGAGQPQILAEQVDQQQARLDVGLVLLAVDGELDHASSAHFLPSARSTARRSARAVSTRTRSLLYSADPRRSSLGWAASAASSRGLLDGRLVRPLALQRGLGLRGLDRRQADVGEADADLIARAAGREHDLRGDGRRREVADLALELQVGAAAARRRRRDPDLGQDLVGLTARSRTVR